MTAADTLTRTQLLTCSACARAAVTYSETPVLPAGWGRLTVEQATADGIAATRHELCPGCRQKVTAAVNAEVVGIRGGGLGG